MNELASKKTDKDYERLYESYFENYKKLFRFYFRKHPYESPDRIKELIEIDVNQQIEKGKSREEAILQILKDFESIPQQIEEHEEAIKKLAVLFAKGEISEQTYKTSVQTLEEKLRELEQKKTQISEVRLQDLEAQKTKLFKELTTLDSKFAAGKISKEKYEKLKSKCKEKTMTIIQQIEKSKPLSPKAYETKKSKPSGLWYLVPLFFSIIGGIIGYVGVKDEDREMAGNLLFFGIFMFFIYLLLAWMYYQWLLNLFRF